VTNADGDEVDCGSWGSQLTTWLDNRANSAATDDCGVPEVIYLLKGVEKTEDDIINYFADSLALNKCIKGSPSNILAAMTIGFAYKDVCGNTSATTLATFKAKDQTPPQINTPAKDISIECDTANIIANLTRWYNNFGGAQIIDDCSKVTNAADLTLIQVKDALALSQSTSCGNTGKVTVKFYAKDACDNPSAFTNATFNVSDKRKPLFSKRPTAKTYECSANLTDSLAKFIGTRAGATAADGCSGISWSYFWKEKNGTTGQASDLPTIKAGCNWYVDVSFVIKDECNNADTAKVRFTIQDTKAPVFANLPSDVSVACNAIPSVPNDISANDACSNTAIVTYKGETGSSAGCAGTYTLTRTWEAVDSCGNKLLGIQKIKVTDNIAPVIANVPASVTVDCKAIPSVPTDISATDNCDLNPTLTFATSSTQGTDQKVCAFHNYTITRTWTAADACGNKTVLSQQIVVKDTKAPQFVVPDDITVECYEGEDLDITGVPTMVEDDCSTYFTADNIDVRTNGNGTCASIGIITRTWTVTDGCLASTKIQTIQLRDSQAPIFYNVPVNVTLDCGSPLPSATGITVADICTVGTNPTIAYNQQTINNGACSSNYQIKRTWTATDACGNTSTSSELVTYIDQQAPTILYCSSDVTANVVDGDCFAILNLPAPIVTDDCNPTISNFSETISKNITSTVPGSTTTAVNDIDFNFSASLTYQQSISNIVLKFNLKNVDAEDALEYFSIIGEDGIVIGKTNSTATQCGNGTTIITTLAYAKMYEWLKDGNVHIKLKANKPTDLAYAINDICPNAAVEGILSFGVKTSSNVSFAYKIDNEPVNTIPAGDANPLLGPGTYKITFYAKDCANNRDSCNYKITIFDNQKPTMAAPANQVFDITTNDCSVMRNLPIPTGIDDNCDFNAAYSQKQLANGDSLLTFSYNPNLLTNIANDVVFTFTGITPSILNNSDIFLNIKLKAKTDRPDGYFNIYGENNTYLGKTVLGDCSNTGFLTIQITSFDFNSWSADGKIVINAIHNRTIPTSAAGSNPGITPCNPSLVNGQDKVSWMTATLSYRSAKPYFYTTGATKIAFQPLLQAGVTPMVDFKRGVTKVSYTIEDAYGNKDTTSYSITVNDMKDPVAKCKNAIIPVNPFTTSNTNFDPMLIDAGSTDNCGIASMSVLPTSFSCSDKGSKTVTLTVIDSSGRMNSCNATVLVENAEAKPSYKLGICGSDTLELYANPPAAQNNATFTYKWTGPNNFISTEKNPKIPNVSVAYSGTYNVTVTNPFASCALEGHITIPINNLPNTPILTASNTKPCTNSELILTTQPYSGKKLKYKWYRNFPVNDILMDSTTVPSFSIYNPKDTGKYYVVVTVDGCTSNRSAPILVMPVKPITATTTNPTLLEICEGGNISLGTSKAGAGYIYQWSGPNGFNSSSQYPTVISDAKPLNSGIYTLIIISNGCESAPVTSEVNVKPKPATPQLIANGRDCEGATINLVTDISGATSWWVRPDFSEEFNQSKTLVINGLSAAKRGEWRVYAIKDGCRSEKSAPVKLVVNPKPVVAATYQSPVCDGGQLTLNGTAPAGSSYVWSNASGVVGNTQNISIVAQAGNYSLAIVAPNGCDNSTSISVTPVPVPQVTVITPNTPPCVTGADNGKLTPTVFPFDPSSNYSYQWTGPNVSSTDKVLTLPNVTAAANGNYILMVMNGAGCQSKPYTYTLELKDIPKTPAIKGAAKQSLCENDDLLLELDNTYTGANVSFKWKTPAGDSITKNPTFKITNVKSFNAGDYSVKVTVNGCESGVSGTKQITITNTPIKPDVTSNSPVCEGSSIKLKTAQINGATYEWVGPGFSSGIAEPIIANATPDKQGAYKVRVSLNGCNSAFSNISTVIVNPTPTQIPSVSNSSPVCMDIANPTVMLSVEPASAVPGATYTWYNTANAPVNATPSVQLNYSLNLSAFAKKDTTYEFYVVATLNGCPAKPSIPTVVSTNKIPNLQAFAGADILVCDASSITLNAAKPTIGAGNWIQTEGSSVTIANPNSSNSAVNGLVPGQNYTLQWKLSNGACKDYSFDELKIKVNDTSFKAEAGDSINICAKNTTQLNAKNLPAGTTGVWSQVVSQEQLGVKITEITNPKTTVTGLTAGNKYVFKWTLSNAACKDYSNDDVYVIVASPQGTAQTEADKKICGSSATINAVPVQGVTGTWMGLGAVQIVSPNSPSTTAKNLQPGVNRVVWILSNAVCGKYSSDTLLIRTEAAALAVNDKIDVPYAGKVVIAVLNNDVVPTTGYTLAIVSKPKYGIAKLSADGSKIEYQANNGFAGIDDIEYELCNAACPDVCTSAKISITVLGGNDCTVPTIITPNGDLTNDRWEIPCLAGSEYPNNTAVVFNQWGDEVFRSNSYKNDWQGTYNGKDLPEGTYFFVVSFGNGETKNGFLIIER
jgi:gliding motility-associated-like protein